MKAFPIPVSPEETTSVAAGSTLGLQQQLLAQAGQPGLTVLAVGFTNTGKVQGISLGNGNVVEVYANGSDFNSGTVLYREFMSLGEPIVFTELSNGAIITATQGFYGVSEQVAGIQESPMPLLSYGLSFTSTFFFGFRNSSSLTGVTNQSYVRIVNGPLASEVTLEFGAGGVVNGQENIALGPWEFLSLQTLGNTEYILKSTNPIMACVHARVNETGTSPSVYYDSRLIMPLTNDGITWPRSGFVSAPFDNTKVDWYVRDAVSSKSAPSLITSRPNITGAQTTLDGLIDGNDTYTAITFTTPAAAPTANNIENIWESGGGGIGCSLSINENFGLSVRANASTGLGIANDRLTSSAALLASTQYTVVVEFVRSTDTINLHYQQAADASWYTPGRTPEDTATAPLGDVSGAGDFSLAGTDTDVGGYSTSPSSYAFTGTIDSIFELYNLTAPMIVSPGSPVAFDIATGAFDDSYLPDGATRVLATGLISAYSGADGSGLEATPLMPTSAMSQVVAQPLFIADTTDGRRSGVAISSPYEGTAKIFEWNDTTKTLDLAYTVPLTRNGVTITTKDDQNHPASALVSNESGVGVVSLVGQLNPGVIIADVPITVVVQNDQPGLGPSNTVRSQNGTTTTGIVDDDDETLMLGITPENIAVEIREDADGILRKRVIDNTGTETWVVA